jgi:AcrR family transcriptional regulator
MGEQLCNMKIVYDAGVTKNRSRPYVKAARAESEAETRGRIVEALLELHEEVGPARTTVKAVAERAGVQRLTVYRHFPDEHEMIAACSALWEERVRFPDLSKITATDARQRARQILIALYRYYRAGERMLTKVYADALHVEAVRNKVASYDGYVEQLVAELERGWRGRSAARRATLRHAVQFRTWQSLAAVSASDEAAADLVLRWCEAV